MALILCLGAIGCKGNDNNDPEATTTGSAFTEAPVTDTTTAAQTDATTAKCETCDYLANVEKKASTFEEGIMK
jgi:hypothetical protein